MEKMLALGVVLSATDMLSPALGRAGKNVGKLEGKIKALGAGITKLGTASLALGTAITTPLGAALTSYQDVAKAQGDIASLGIDDSGIKKITKAAMEFSNQFAGTTAPDFIKASYDIKSGIASLSDEGVAQFTKLSAMTASATKSTTEEMTKLFALGHGIFKNANETDFEFGDRMSAQIAQAVQAFRTDGSDLTLGISNIGAQAKKMGVSLSEELAIIGNAKSAFNSASEAATGYRAFLDGAASAQDELGLSFTDSEGKMLPMVQVLQKIKDKYGDDLGSLEVQQELKKAFGSSEAVKIVNALIDKTDDLTKSQKQLQNATLDNVKAMALARNKGKEFDILGQKMGNLSAVIGQSFAPIALKASEIIGGVITKIQKWTTANPELTKTITTVLSVGGGLLTVFGVIGISVGAITMALPALATAFGVVSGAVGFLGSTMAFVGRIFLMNPIGLAVTAIGAAAYIIYKNWGAIKGFFSDMWDGIKSIFSSTIDFIKTYLGWTPLGMILNNWQPINSFFTGLWDGVVNIFSSAWTRIKTSFNSVVGYLKKPFVAFFDWIASKFEWITKTVGAVVDKVSNIGKGIKDTAGNIVSSIGDGLKTASNWFKFGSDDKKEKSQLEREIEAKKQAGSYEKYQANNTNFKIGSTMKKVAVATAVSSQLVAAQPNIQPMQPQLKTVQPKEQLVKPNLKLSHPNLGTVNPKLKVAQPNIQPMQPQLKTVQPKLNYAPMPRVQYSKPKEIQQTNHIKVVVNNPSSTVDVQKAIVGAMNEKNTDRGLSDEDI